MNASIKIYNMKISVLFFSIFLLFASTSFAISPTCSSLFETNSKENERLFQVFKNYFKKLEKEESTLQFSRKLEKDGKEESGNYELRIIISTAGYAIRVNDSVEMVIMLDNMQNKNLKILKTGQELILDYVAPYTHRRLSFAKDDLGNITSVIMDDIRNERLVILDQPVKPNELTQRPATQPTVFERNNDGFYVNVAMQSYFRKQLRNNKVSINFSKFLDSSGIEHLELNVFTFELRSIVNKMYIGARGLGIWTMSYSPTKLIESTKKGELHLQWTRPNSVRHIIFQKDDLGNLSSITWIEEKINSSGELSTETRVYYN